jgi:hypothetical protein
MSDGTGNELMALAVFLGANDGKSASKCHGKIFRVRVADEAFEKASARVILRAQSASLTLGGQRVSVNVIEPPVGISCGPAAVL